MKSVFIMSSERSGSNLLRKMLGMHSSTSAPPPPHMWRHLSPEVYQYGRLSDPENLRHLASDALSMTKVKESHLYWDCDIELDAVLSSLKSHSLTGVITALYELYASKQGATTWICKENNIFEHAFQIRNMLPDAKFIYLCRDGRDVACSVKKVPSHDQHIWFIAKEWYEEQQKCLLVYQELLEKDAVLLVRYEDLISDTESELHRICDFVGLSYELQMLQFYQAQDSKQEASKTSYWKNLSQPVMANNKAKFFNELSVKEIALFETAAGDILSLLGYPLVAGNDSQKIGRLSLLSYFVSNKIQTYLQRRKMLQETGRAERQAMLKKIHNQHVDEKQPFAPPITYDQSL